MEWAVTNFLQNGKTAQRYTNILSLRLCIRSAAEQDALLLSLYQIPDICEIVTHISYIFSAAQN